MPYITREDGEHFVIPSYREITFAKQKATLKKEVLSLSKSYGDHVTINRKGPNQYEVAFSPDAGYSLGETVWHHFGRPLDMIYCEAISDSSEAILVIVKDGSVYLDGSFPVDSIPEELVIFLTQQNNFDIYLYGDVPISQEPEDGKFSFDEGSVNSFTILEDPVFNTLPLLKAYQFMLVEPALKAAGVGAFPVLQLAMILAGVVVAWVAISFITAEKKETKVVEVMEKNPLEEFVQKLQQPAPVDIINEIAATYKLSNSITGWYPIKLNYIGKAVSIEMQSIGGTMEFLQQWAELNDANVVISSKGVKLVKILYLENRKATKEIYPVKDIVLKAVDNIRVITPDAGFRLKVGRQSSKEKYRNIALTVSITDKTPVILNMLAEQTRGLPIVVDKVDLTIRSDLIGGSINLIALGS